MESVIGEVLSDKILAHVGMEGVVVFDNDGLDGLVGGARSRVLGGWGCETSFAVNDEGVEWYGVFLSKLLKRNGRNNLPS